MIRFFRIFPDHLIFYFFVFFVVYCIQSFLVNRNFLFFGSCTPAVFVIIPVCLIPLCESMYQIHDIFWIFWYI